MSAPVPESPSFELCCQIDRNRTTAVNLSNIHYRVACFFGTKAFGNSPAVPLKDEEVSEPDVVDGHRVVIQIHPHDSKLIKRLDQYTAMAGSLPQLPAVAFYKQLNHKLSHETPLTGVVPNTITIRRTKGQITMSIEEHEMRTAEIAAQKAEIVRWKETAQREQEERKQSDKLVQEQATVIQTLRASYEKKLVPLGENKNILNK